jgi:PAS domain-containing protein
MRVKHSRSRNQKSAPAPFQQRRRSKRRTSRGLRGASPALVPIPSGQRNKIQPSQWLTFLAIGLISLALIALIWTLTARAIEDQDRELRTRTDQQVQSVASALAVEIQDELRLVDQSLAIIQDNWNKNSDSVDLGEWRKQLLALTDVASDIFIANEQGIIVQGTLPQSVGQGFGSAYVTYPNGSLEAFGPNGTQDIDGKYPSSDKIEARQFVMYVVRPLDKPRGWWTGASYRSEGITKLFAGARLGDNGLVGLADLKRGALQAVVGSIAQFANMDLANSALIEQMRKNESGIWDGEAPMDRVPRILAYQRVPGRDMTVLAGIAVDTAARPLGPLASTAWELAAAASLIVLSIAGILVWAIATANRARQRRRAQERLELTLMNTRQELALTRARTLLTEPEAVALMSSSTHGVARLDAEQRLRQWNHRFAQLAGVPLDTSGPAMPVEELFRRQASTGVFGDVAESDQEVATRLTVIHASGQSVAPPIQHGPDGEHIAMHVRGMTDGGHVIVLATQESSHPLVPPVETESETEDETTDW